MILTDKKALKYLEECIQELQKDDRTDLEVLYDELCWDLDCMKILLNFKNFCEV